MAEGEEGEGGGATTPLRSNEVLTRALNHQQGPNKGSLDGGGKGEGGL